MGLRRMRNILWYVSTETWGGRRADGVKETLNKMELKESK